LKIFFNAVKFTNFDRAGGDGDYFSWRRGRGLKWLPAIWVPGTQVTCQMGAGHPSGIPDGCRKIFCILLKNPRPLLANAAPEGPYKRIKPINQLIQHKTRRHSKIHSLFPQDFNNPNQSVNHQCRFSGRKGSPRSVTVNSLGSTQSLNGTRLIFESLIPLNRRR